MELGHLKALVGDLELKLKEKEAVDFENQKLKTLIRSTLQEGEEIQRRMSNFEGKGGSLTGLDTSVELLERNLREREMKNNILIGELDRVNSLLSSKLTEVQELNSKCLDLENSLREKKTIEKEKLKLREILAQKLEENENQERRIVGLEAKLFELIGEAGRQEELAARCQVLERELAEKSRLIGENSGGVSSHDFNIRERAAMQQEINELRSHINIKYSENEELKRRVNELSIKNPQAAELLATIDQKEDQLRKCMQEFQNLSNIAAQLEMERESWRLKYFKGDRSSGLGAGGSRADEEQSKLLSLLDERNREVEQLRISQADLQGKIFDYESKIELLLNRLEQGNILLEEKIGEVTRPSNTSFERGRIFI